MAPSLFPKTSLELDYPIWACEFDPNDSGRLIVGGGGGASRTGVGNKITVIDTSSPEELRIAADVALSPDEDSVSSLAVGAAQSKARLSTTLLYAGINSSAAHLAKHKSNRNEHLRVFSLEQSKSRASVGAKTPLARIEEVSRTALFSSDAEDKDPETYQRLLRLSAPGAGAVGVVASALGRESQVVVFDVGTAGAPKFRSKINLRRDATDVDVIRTGETTFQVAYCFDYELYTVDITKGATAEPRLAYTLPQDPQRPVFRSIRYLTPTFILAAANLPASAGIIVQAYRLPAKPTDPARLGMSTRIPSRTKAARIAVCNLSPPPASGTIPSRLGDAQFLIAIANQDSSIALYTLEHRTAPSIEVLAEMRELHTVRNAHGSAQITAVAFSTPPSMPPKLSAGALGPSLKVATTSLVKTVVVHQIPLKRFVNKSALPRGPPRPSRYVVAARPRTPNEKTVVILIALFVAILAVIGQGVSELYGWSRPIIYAREILPASWHPTNPRVTVPTVAEAEVEFHKQG